MLILAPSRVAAACRVNPIVPAEQIRSTPAGSARQASRAAIMKPQVTQDLATLVVSS